MFQTILNFIFDNWMWILPIILSIVEFIFLLLFRKNKIINSSDMYGEILNYVILAEKHFGAGHGEEKLQYVIDLYFSAHPTPYPQLFTIMIKSVVNQILSSPTKKGGSING